MPILFKAGQGLLLAFSVPICFSQLLEGFIKLPTQGLRPDQRGTEQAGPAPALASLGVATARVALATHLSPSGGQGLLFLSPSVAASHARQGLLLRSNPFAPQPKGRVP